MQNLAISQIFRNSIFHRQYEVNQAVPKIGRLRCFLSRTQKMHLVELLRLVKPVNKNFMGILNAVSCLSFSIKEMQRKQISDGQIIWFFVVILTQLFILAV